MNVIVNEQYVAGTYFLESINNPIGIFLIRIIILAIGLFIMGFYFYIRNKNRREDK